MLVPALVLILVAVAYFLVTTLVDLFPLNNVRGAARNERWTEVAINAPLLTLPAVVLAIGAAVSSPALGYVAGSLESLAAISGLLLWWLPYLAGVVVPWATAGGVSWPELHARTYAHTIVVVPPIGDRPRPNLEHTILHALFVAAAVCTFAAAPALA
ncbi:hypothetical protein ACQP2E_18475 [Actinoplanes sp. CA-015351]|uniref:hypothetical protein n=1 Tax=Actinoplanes sp. CA-015351 TaxID=3239897 RepID=UPI003D992E57